ncbi:conjugal transfer protein TraD [Xanthomonas axonopodis pv. cassiae]|uniref:conjugal transfer protein TraD n=1 Tax=Xanthomonas euvesicatoria TaxID=456327 RepID=UPI001C45AF32|nr:conjugal transfer protein TraD [Xanthomonas euvesicatoria]MBV6803188.1 conjugal transfer protein TraD [Xanthomonas campestris pv. lawsoniae]
MPKSDLTQALTAIEPKTKAAKVREVMPVIEQRIAAGVRIADILKTLKDSGIDLTEATLKSYLYRYRKKHQAKTKGQQSASRTVGMPTPPQPGESESVSHETDSPETSTPRGPISMQELDRLMKPDPEEQAKDIARYERLAKEKWRKHK